MKPKLLITFLLILCGAIFWAAHIEPKLLIVKNIKLCLPNWHSGLNGFRVVVISDLHLGSGRVDLKKLDNIVKLSNRQKPDLVLLLGDLDGQSIGWLDCGSQSVINSMKKFQAKYGVISVLGNHDYEPANFVKYILSASDIKVLEDNYTFVMHKGRRICIAGMTDLWKHKSSPAKVIQRVAKDVPIIMLAHNPDYFPRVPERVSLTLSGHTHGGEVSLPIVGSPFIPSDFGQRFSKGYVVENNRHLFVTSGIGTLSRMRFGNIPEIVVLNLYSQNNKNLIVNTKFKFGFSRDFIPLYRSVLAKVKSL